MNNMSVGCDACLPAIRKHSQYILQEEGIKPNIICYKRYDNLIPGMALWKQNLLNYALAAAVAFEILSLWSYALR